MQFILYGTQACHLCEQARDLIWPLLREGDVLQEVDIVEDDGLVALYGIRIPVLKAEHSGVELNWPFSSEDIQALADA